MKPYQDKTFIFATNSLGGNLVAEMEPFPDNCKGLILTGPLIIGGNILVSDIIQPNPNVGAPPLPNIHLTKSLPV